MRYPPAETAPSRLLAALAGCRTVALVGHERADGDCAGSIAALAAFLEAADRDTAPPHLEVRCLLPGGIPERYGFLFAGRFTAAPLEPPEAAVALDVAAPKCMAEYADIYQNAGMRLVIDHHPDNSLGVDIAWLQPGASSVAEMLWGVLKAPKGGKPSAQMLDALYVGMMTDTGRFSFSNTKASTLEAAARLVRMGVDAAGLFDRVYRQRPLELMRLEGLLLNRLRLYHGGKVAVAAISAEEFAACRKMSTEDLAARTLEPAGVQVGVLLLEIEPGKTKISLRSRGGVDVAEVAHRLGGGGHREAAAAQMAGSVETVKEEVLRLLEGVGAASRFAS